MSKSTVPDLKDLFKQAAEIAAQVPENMQEAAFNRAVDLLTGNRPVVLDKQSTLQKPQKAEEKKLIFQDNEINSSATDLLSTIDSTKHPEVLSASKVLDRALMVLQIALADHDVDGLTPSTIAKILTDKFRINTTNYAVSMALGKATTLVNRIPNGQGFSYKIMAPGTKYLENLGTSKDSSMASTPVRKVRTKRTTIKVNNATSAHSGGTKKLNRKTNKKDFTDQQVKKKNGIGPKTAILSLIASGFFDEGKTGPEVQTHIKNKRGFGIGTAQLRLAMLRLVRDDKLTRDENAEGHYEYKKFKA